jgi:hypothetical protein
MNTGFMESALRQFEYYKMLGEKTFEQLNDEQLFWRNGDETNSIAIIIKHLWGNMLSRWTDFLTTDGEKEWRDRDAEFDVEVQSRKDLLEKWEEGWSCLFAALHPLTDSDLQTIVYIRNQGHTVLEAINRQLAHYPYHVGQIVCIGKMLSGDNWQSLSILRGQSETFNQEKFSIPRRQEHFTDELRNKEGK